MIHFTVRPETSVAVCNSVHPALQTHLLGALARKVPGRDDLYYSRTQQDDCVVTFRSSDRTVSVFKGSYEQFKAHMSGNAPGEFTEAIDVPDKTKHIATVMVEEILAFREG